MIQKLVPDAKTVGVFYTSSETNSKLQADMAIEAGEKLGYTWRLIRFLRALKFSR